MNTEGVVSAEKPATSDKRDTNMDDQGNEDHQDQGLEDNQKQKQEFYNKVD